MLLTGVANVASGSKSAAQASQMLLAGVANAPSGSKSAAQAANAASGSKSAAQASQMLLLALHRRRKCHLQASPMLLLTANLLHRRR